MAQTANVFPGNFAALVVTIENTTDAQLDQGYRIDFTLPEWVALDRRDNDIFTEFTREECTYAICFSGERISWFMATLAPNETRYIMFLAKIDDDAPIGEEIDFGFEVGPADPGFANNPGEIDDPVTIISTVNINEAPDYENLFDFSAVALNKRIVPGEPIVLEFKSTTASSDTSVVYGYGFEVPEGMTLNLNHDVSLLPNSHSCSNNGACQAGDIMSWIAYASPESENKYPTRVYLRTQTTLTPPNEINIRTGYGLYKGLDDFPETSSNTRYVGLFAEDNAALETVELAVDIVGEKAFDARLDATVDTVGDGSEFELVVNLANKSNQTMVGSVFVLDLPAGLASVSGSSQTYSETVPRIRPGETLEYRVPVIYTDPESGSSSAHNVLLNWYDDEMGEVLAVHSSSVYSVNLFPLDVALVNTSREVIAGESFNFSINLANTSSETFEWTQINFRVPNGFSFEVLPTSENVTSVGCTNCSTGQKLSYVVDPLTEGQNVQLLLRGSVSDDFEAGDLVSMPVQIMLSGSVEQEAGNESDIYVNNFMTFLEKTIVVVTEQVMDAQLDLSSGFLAAGSSGTIDIIGSNLTNDALENVSFSVEVPAFLLTDPLPAGVTRDGNTLTWTVSRVIPNETALQTIPFEIDPLAPPGSLVNATLLVSADDYVGEIRQVMRSAEVVPSAPLSATAELQNVTVTANGELTYLFQVGNLTEEQVFNNVYVHLILPSGVASFDARTSASQSPDASAGCFNNTNHTGCAAGDSLIWSLASLAPGDSKTVRLTVPIDEEVVAGTLLASNIFVYADELADRIMFERTARVLDDDTSKLHVSASTDALVPGQTFDYQVLVANDSNSGVLNSQLSLVLPPNVTVNKVSDGGIVDGARVSWAINSMAPGTSARRTLEVILDDDAVPGANLFAEAIWTHDDGEVVDAKAHALQSVSEPLEFAFGFELEAPVTTLEDGLQYLISVANLSEFSVVENVTVTVRLPLGVDNLDGRMDASIRPTRALGCFSNNNTSGCDHGHLLEWTFAELAPGESRTIRLDAPLNLTATSDRLLDVPVVVKADGLGDTLLISRAATLRAANDHDVALHASQDPALAGGELTYTVNAANSSLDAVEDSVFELSLPEGVDIASISDGGTEIDGVVTWELAMLPAGSAVARTVEVIIADTALDGQLLNASVTWDHSGAGHNPIINYSLESIRQPLDIDVQYELADTIVTPGGQLQYQISIGNRSDFRVFENVQLRVVLPSGVDGLDGRTDLSLPVSDALGCFSNTQPSGCDGGHLLVWTFEELSPGESSLITISAPLIEELAHGKLLTAPVVITGDDLLDTILIKRTAVVQNTRALDLAVSASADGIAPGSEFEYRLMASNPAANPAANTILELTLPEDVVVESISDGGVQEGRQIVWPEVDLGPAAHTLRTVTVSLSQAALAGQNLVAKASARADGGLETDAEAFTGTSVSEDLELAVELALASRTIEAGGDLVYTISITNNTEFTTVANVVVGVQLPQFVEDLAAADLSPNATSQTGCFSSTPSGCDADAKLRWLIEAIEPGITETIVISAPIAEEVIAGRLIMTPVVVTADSLNDTIVVSDSAVLNSGGLTP